MKIVKILFFLSCLAFINAQSLHNNAEDAKEWMAFKIFHKKTYSGFFNELIHKKNYFENKAKVLKYNLNQLVYGARTLSWKASVNKFADMTFEEFNSVMNGFISELKKPSKETYKCKDGFKAPDELDYRKLGYVSDVKDQGSCGSCYAFSATGSLEGQIFKANKTLVSLSEQNIIDCSFGNGNKGCSGGTMDRSFEYIQENHGINTEKDYPYKGVAGMCKYDEKNKGGEVSDYMDIESGCDNALLQALVEKGPISVSVSVDESFKLYSSGVFHSDTCDGKNLNHAVLLVGYGTDQESGKKYWLIKNSWGKSWGENGYIRISRETKNNCGISSKASFPII